MIKTTLATLATIVTGVVAGLVVTVPSPASATAETGNTACQRVWNALPDAMQEDIAAAVSLPPRAEHRAIVAIRYAALHGVYGHVVEHRAEQLHQRRAQIYRTFPPQLKADLRAARSLPYREQTRAMTAIRAAALHGVYGDDVQRTAEKQQTFYDGCTGVAATTTAEAGDALSS